MARQRTIEIREINISMHSPHSPEGYVDLFVKAFQLQRISTRGESDGYMLGSLQGVGSAVESNELLGEVYRFTNIDPQAPWFNTQTGRPADDHETTEIKIPGHLHPNLKKIYFIFRPKEHRFWYISKNKDASISPQVAVNFLKALFSEVSRVHNLPTVEVTAVPSEFAVDQVLSIYRITNLVLEFKRPNSDDGDDISQIIMKKMEQRNVNTLREVMTSKSVVGIRPDDEIRAEAKVAASNGFVEANGYNVDGVKVTESTKTKPAVHHVQINENRESVWNVLGRVSSNLFRLGERD